MSGRRRALAALAALAALGGAVGAGRSAPTAPAVPVATTVADSGLAAGRALTPARVSVRPDHVALGEPVRYQAWVLVPRGVRAQWLPPDSGGVFTWSAVAARRMAGRGGRDTLMLESRLQIFAPGRVSVPGPRFQLPGGRDRAARQLPMATVTVEPSPGVADSAAQLRPVRAPLAAPWWERVPWTWVALGAGLLAAFVAWIVWLSRRRPAAPARVPAVAVVPRGPAELALAELEALRRLGLPEQGRFGEHALELTRIARRFLEATAGTPRPGDSTPELVLHLEAARLDPGQVARLAAVLRAWDQIKFAREPSTVEESRRAEQTVEEMARRHLAGRQEPQAADESRVA